MVNGCKQTAQFISLLQSYTLTIKQVFLIHEIFFILILHFGVWKLPAKSMYTINDHPKSILFHSFLAYVLLWKTEEFLSTASISPSQQSYFEHTISWKHIPMQFNFSKFLVGACPQISSLLFDLEGSETGLKASDQKLWNMDYFCSQWDCTIKFHMGQV